MLQSIAKGYIEKEANLPKNRSLTQRVAEFKGILKIGKKDVLVEVFTDSDTKERLFVRLSREVSNDLYGEI